MSDLHETLASHGCVCSVAASPSCLHRGERASPLLLQCFIPQPWGGGGMRFQEMGGYKE